MARATVCRGACRPNGHQHFGDCTGGGLDVQVATKTQRGKLTKQFYESRFLQKDVKEINVPDVSAVDIEGQEELEDIKENNVPDVVEDEIEEIEEIEEYNEPEWQKNPVLFAQFREKLIGHVDNRIRIDRKRRYRQSGF